MVILYEVHDNLYVNMTNKCPCACTFCLRQTRNEMNHSGSLWLEREPSVEEVKNEFSKFDMNKYKEVVFCGFGEPTERLDDVLEVCRFIKDKYNKTIRINTNGLADLIHKRTLHLCLTDLSILFRSALIRRTKNVILNLHAVNSVSNHLTQ